MKLKTGDLIIIRKNPFKWYSPVTWVASLIRLFCNTRYNHCGVVVENWGIPVINEAVFRGVMCTPVNRCLGNNEIVVLRPRDPISERDFAIAANAFLCVTGYDFFSLFVAQPIFILFGVWVGKKGPSADGTQTCSEYAANCYGLADSYRVNPAELLKSEVFVTIFVGNAKNLYI